MSELHRIIINRLMAAWVAVSLLVGGAVLYMGLSKIDSQMVEQVSTDSQRTFGDQLANTSEATRDDLMRQVEQLTRADFALVNVYDKSGNKIAFATNAKYPGVTGDFALGVKPELADKPHHEKIQRNSHTLLLVQSPLFDADKRLSGYFEGVQVVNPETVKRLRLEATQTLAIILGAILLTTVTLYPVIIALNKDVIRFSNDLLKGNIQLMEVLGSAIAKRDSDTNIHNYRVTIYSVRLAEAAKIAPTAMRDIIVGSFLHDVGKIGISDNILLKPGRLNDDEFSIMKTHVTLGLDILNKAEWLQRARDIVEGHHEKFDGKGYPKGLAGESIPIAARIFAICDIFDALTSKRPYKEPLTFEESMTIINGYAGNHLDPRLVGLFNDMIRPLFMEISSLPEYMIEEMLRELTAKYFVVSSTSAVA